MTISRHVLLCGPAEPGEIFDCADHHQLPHGLGGVPVNLLARALVSHGWRVTVVSTSPDVAKLWRHREADLEVVLVPARASARTRALDLFKVERRALTTEIRRQQPDLVHAHWTYEFALAALASGLPTLVTAHDAPLKILRHYRDPYRTMRLAMALWVRMKRPQLTAVSPYLAEQWRREMCWHQEMAIIPNITPFKLREGVRDNCDTLRVVTVAENSRLKNVKAAIMAWPAVLRAFPDAELHLVGHGLGSSDDLASWAERHAKQNQIVWHGSIGRADVESLMGSAAVLLHPSLEESIGIALIEAMSQGITVVGGIGSGAVPWTIGEGGKLTDVRSPDSIAATVIDLLRDPEMRSRLGEAGRRRVAEVFSPEVVVHTCEEQYRTVLESRQQDQGVPLRRLFAYRRGAER